MSRHPSEHGRIMEAYIQMATSGRYRPAAPGDGVGGINLTRKQLKDGKILSAEAVKYADAFIQEEDTLKYWIGVTDFAGNREFVYALEACRLMCAGEYARALRLVRMAQKGLVELTRPRGYRA